MKKSFSYPQKTKDYECLEVKKVGKKREKAWFFVCLFVVAFLSLAKLWLASVSIDGRFIRDVMVADYWNFAANLRGGKLLYRDLVDHKGLYLFALPYALQAIFGTKAIGVVAIVEATMFFATIASFYLFARKGCGLSVNKSSVLSGVAAVCYFFASIGAPIMNTEGYAAIALMLVYAYAFRAKEAKPLPFALIGMALGILGNMKFTAVAPFFPAFLLVAATHLKGRNGLKRLIFSIFTGIFGFVVVNIPFAWYLLKHDLVEDCIGVFGTTSSLASLIGTTKIALILLVMAMICLCVWKEQANLLKTTTIAGSVLLVIVFGSNAPYYLQFCVLIFVMIFASSKSYAKIPIAIIIVAALASLLLNNKFFFDGMHKVDRKEVFDALGTTNANTLYFSEDFGFGVFGGELYAEPLQWIPSKMLASNEFSRYIIDLTIERVKERRFKYIFVTNEVVEYTKTDEFLAKIDKAQNSEAKVLDNSYYFFYEVVPILEQYYELSSEYDFIYVVK